MQAECSFGDDVPPVRVALCGVGKFPFVRPSTPSLDFGRIVVGSSVEHPLHLVNATPAACDFTVSSEQQLDDNDGVFAISASSGRVAGDARLPVTVTFTPNAPGAFSREAFVITTPGGAPTRLTCMGTAVSPGVTCSAKAVSFGPVAVGQVSTQRFVQLDNASGEVAVRYMMDACTGGSGPCVFEFSGAVGVIPAKGFVQVGIVFRPGTAASYHRRITIILADAPPLGLDLIGTGFTPKARPPEVGIADLLSWRTATLGHRSRHQCVDDIDEAAHAYMASATGDPTSAILVEVPDTDSPGVIDFGPAAQAPGSPLSRQVVVRNTTRHTMEVFWHELAAGGGGSAATASSPFVVLPDTADIEPGDSATFRVAFQPVAESTVYGTRLELYAHAKSQRSWRLADPTETVLPPWGCALTCVGHTHGANPDRLPDVRVMVPGAAFGRNTARTPLLVSFPAAWASEHHTVYRTITLVNSEKTNSVAWAVAPLAAGSAFTVRPSAGFVGPDSHVLLCVAFTPTQAGSCSATLSFLLNGTPAPSLECHLHGIGCTPKLILSTSLLQLRPTCVGATSVRRLCVRNPTRLPLAAKLVVPQMGVENHANGSSSNSAVLTHDRGDTFIIAGRDEHDVTFTFAPAAVGSIDVQASLQCWPHLSAAGCSIDALETSGVRVLGDAAPCALRIEPANVDLGHLGCSTHANVAVTLYNDSGAPLECTWAPSTPTAGLLTPQATAGVSSILRLAPRSSTPAVLTLRQSSLGETVTRIALAPVCHTMAAQLHADSAVATKLEVRSVGEAPRLRVFAATCHGLSVSDAWRHLRCDAINAALSASQGDAVHLSVGVAPVGAKASVIHLWLHNPSLVAAHWSAHLEGGSFGVVSAAHLEGGGDASTIPVPFCGSTKTLFDLAPHAGMLAPGQTVRIALAYGHEAMGVHSSIAFLKIATAPGRGAASSLVKLMLTGRTLRDARTPALCGPGVDRSGLRLHANLQPHPLGLLAPALLSVRLHSAAACDCTYTLDTTALDGLTAKHSGCSVLTCLNPSGWIPAGSATALHFAFRPVVAAPLAVTLPLVLVCAAALDDSLAPPAAEVISVALTARAYHPLHAMQPTIDGLHVLMNTSLSLEAPPALPGQLGAIEPSSAAFPELPPSGTASIQVRIMPLPGNGATEAGSVHFAWELGEGALAWGASLSVVPATGRVMPGGVICTVTLAAPSTPCLLHTTLRCVFTPHDCTPASTGVGALRGSRAARVARMEATLRGDAQLCEAGHVDDKEEVIAQHGFCIGRPLIRPPRPERKSIIYAATISSALKRPLALRDAPSPATPAATTQALAAAVGLAKSIHVAVLDLWAPVELPASDEMSLPFEDDYVDLNTDFACETRDNVPDLPSDSGACMADASVVAATARASSSSVVSTRSYASTTATILVDRAVEDLLDCDEASLGDNDGLGEEGTDSIVISPEDADTQAVEACDAFLKAVEDLLDGVCA